MYASREKRSNANPSNLGQRSTTTAATPHSSTSTSPILQMQRSIGNRATSQVLQRQQQTIIQRHLFVDTPRDFRQLEDLGMWWVMASEWKYQKSIPNNVVSQDPKDYITSLGAVDDAKGKIKDKEQISMVAHGFPDGKHIEVDKTKTKVSDKKTEIKNTFEDGGKRTMDDSQFLPLYCYTGGADGMWTSQGNSGLKDGPLLMPAGNFASIDLTKGLGNWGGGDFITNQGAWKAASSALGKLPKLKDYKDAQAHDGVKLGIALDEVFTAIKQEYDDFVKELTPSGTTPNTWGV